MMKYLITLFLFIFICNISIATTVIATFDSFSPTISQGTNNVPVFSITLRTNQDQAVWTNLRLEVSSHLRYSDISQVKIYRDEDNNGIFNTYAVNDLLGQLV